MEVIPNRERESSEKTGVLFASDVTRYVLVLMFVEIELKLEQYKNTQSL